MSLHMTNAAMEESVLNHDDSASSSNSDSADSIERTVIPLDTTESPRRNEKEASLYDDGAPSVSSWHHDDDAAFLMALQNGFDDSGLVPYNSERRRSRGRSDMERVALEKVLEQEQRDGVEENGDNHNDVELAGPNETQKEKDPTDNTSNTETKSQDFHIDRHALQFGIRISTVLTVSSLFVLVQSPDDDALAYPQGLWVYISALMVSWFPSMTAAAVAEKTFQRIMGTIIGAALGCGCGFASLLFPSYTSQAIFMGVCIAIVSFFYSFVTIQFKTSFFGKYSYASLLCLLTFGIALLPFYTDEHPKYKKGVFRVINVIVGCAIGGLGSLIIWPRSTKRLLKDKIQSQVKLAGAASEAVLEFAAETFERLDRESTPQDITPASHLSMRRVVDGSEQQESNSQDDQDKLNDAAHEKYNQAISEWKEVNGVFKLQKYDPFNLCRDSESDKLYTREVALTLARALRIQTTIVLLDGIVRNDRQIRFNELELDLVREIGVSIKTMLTPPYNEDNSQCAAEHLLDCLDDIRNCVVQESVEVAATARTHRRLFTGSVGKEEYKAMLEKQDRGIPLCVHKRDRNSLLFLQLVEHLIMRSLRLYFIWRKVEK